MRPKTVKPVHGATCASQASCPPGRQGSGEVARAQEHFFVPPGNQHVTCLPQLLTHFARSVVHSFTRLSSVAGQLSSPPAQTPLQSTAANVWVGVDLSKPNTRAVRRHEKSYVFWTWFESTFMVTPQRCASSICVLFFQKYLHKLSL